MMIGTPYQGSLNSKFVYDSGSGYLAVTSSNCTTCSNGYQYYNPDNSSTASKTLTPNKTVEYGSASLTGYMMRDNACMNPDYTDTCNSEFKFFYVTSETGLSNLDGVLGMGPNVSGEGNGPSYMGSLVSAG